MTVELLYEKECPNVAAARANLDRAFALAGLPARWTEWETSSPSAPARLRGCGSPAVLVNARDVAGAGTGDAASCRLYDVAGTRSGAPSAEQIAGALVAARHEPRSWRRTLLVVPAATVALVPGLTCPACWPGYAALLSALGLGFIPTAPYLLPLTAGLLVVALAALALRATRVPLALGAVASVIILLGKFVFESNPMNYLGAGLLLAASLPTLRRRGEAAACPACVSDESARHASPKTPMEGR